MFAPGWEPEPGKPWPERLHSLWRSLGMSFRFFALELGVDHESLRSWLLGGGAPQGTVVERIEALEREGLRATSLWPG